MTISIKVIDKSIRINKKTPDGFESALKRYFCPAHQEATASLISMFINEWSLSKYGTGRT